MTTQHAVTLPFVTKTKQNHITWASDCKITQTHVHTHRYETMLLCASKMEVG